MKQEVKDVLQLLLIVLPCIAIIYLGYFNSPMYKNMYRQQREEALFYLQRSYFLPGYISIDREAIIDRYGFTEEELNPRGKK